MTADELIAIIQASHTSGESLAYNTFIKVHPGTRYALDKHFRGSWLLAKQLAGLNVKLFKKYDTNKVMNPSNEAEWVDPYRPEERKLRPCLRCPNGELFESRWAGERFCDKHRTNNGDDDSGPIGKSLDIMPGWEMCA
jgi:hypothetical protein